MRLDIYILRAVPCSILAQEKGERLVIVTYGNAHMARLEIYGLASRNIWIARSTMQHSGTSEGERLVIGPACACTSLSCTAATERERVGEGG